MIPDPYETLGITPDATPAEIRAAFRDKVRASHPDTSTESIADGDVIAVVDAYRRLMSDAAGHQATNRAAQGPGSARRIEVRRSRSSGQANASLAPCATCNGLGVVMAWSECPGCRGAGTITRLEAHRARVIACPRCLGRGGAGHRSVCDTCQGAGTVGADRKK